MPYISPTELNRRQALSQALMQQPRDKATGALGGLAYMLRQYGAGRGGYLAGQQEQQNADLRRKEMGALLQSMSGNTAVDPSTFEHPDVQELYAKQLLAEKLAERKAQTQSPPANIQEWQAYQQMSPEDREQYLGMKRAAPWLNLGGTMAQPMLTNPQQKAAEIPVTLKPADVPENYAAKMGAGESAQQAAQIAAIPEKKAVERVAELAANQTKAETVGASKFAKTEMLKTEIDEAKQMAGSWTTGLVGSTMKNVPGTAAHDLSKKLDTIKANIGFDRLQEMRDSSPTGGALGQVSERENALLQSVWGNLEQSQSEAQFKANLEKVRKQVDESWARVAAAYEKDYGKPMSDAGSGVPEGVDPADWEVMTPEERALFQ